MNKTEMLELVKREGLLAVIRGPSAELTVQMVDALVAGGVLGIEITYSTPRAEEVVARLHAKYGEQILLGMGTLTQAGQAETAGAAGAGFLVSPICEAGLVKAMVASELLVMAGALTPTEVFQAWQLGADVVKVFPGSLAGPAYLQALHGPFPQIALMPTGGVSLGNIGEWFGAGAIAVGAGSELCPTDLAKAGKFEEISRRAEEFVQAVRATRNQKGQG
ncbi:MAG TPA: bifunctional 4-hydroxy-2-oxoglutarate aldolase/2-dehydro-3-deoxy-phosphogluconate aldolase [Armatimonadota bacterium]|jgi:2-dehydro-3-deoxyphosphogluconate aldolase/(4S)-4-hydroxy-2-oxoglutarate aldolase